MASKLGTNLRQGHLAEDLGIFFLRSFCAVAQIRHEDDFGIDAIATLLKHQGNVLNAEESFAVQVKASSVEKIDYEGQALEWLFNLTMPFFILKVDLKKGVFEMYTTNPIYGLFVSSKVKSVSLKFDRPSSIDRIIQNENHADIQLGPPIFETNLTQLESKENALKLYELMKSWVSSEIAFSGLRALSIGNLASWAPWGTPKYIGVVSKGSDKNLQRDMKIIEPWITYLSNHVINSMSPNEKLATLFLNLKEWFEDNQVDSDINDAALEEVVKRSKRS